MIDHVSSPVPSRDGIFKSSRDFQIFNKKLPQDKRDGTVRDRYGIFKMGRDSACVEVYIRIVYYLCFYTHFYCKKSKKFDRKMIKNVIMKPS